MREFMPGDIVDGPIARYRGAEVIEERDGLLKTDKGLMRARDVTLIRPFNTLYNGQHEAGIPFDVLMRSLI